MIKQSEIAKLCQLTGMTELQAYRHIRQRNHLMRWHVTRPTRIEKGN